MLNAFCFFLVFLVPCFVHYFVLHTYYDDTFIYDYSNESCKNQHVHQPRGVMIQGAVLMMVQGPIAFHIDHPITVGTIIPFQLSLPIEDAPIHH